MPNFPITQAVRVLRQNNVDFEPFLFDYVEKGGAKHSADVLGVDQHIVVKTLVFETNEKKPLIVLMHGDKQVSTKDLARQLGHRSIEPVSPDRANKLTGYLVGGTSPFGIKTKMPIYAERSIFDLEKIYINGGKRGFLVLINSDVLKNILNASEIEAAI